MSGLGVEDRGGDVLSVRLGAKVDETNNEKNDGSGFLAYRVEYEDGDGSTGRATLSFQKVQRFVRRTEFR